MDDLITYNTFYKRDIGNGSAYNYDLAPLIDSFSFYDFAKNGMRKRADSKSHGGFLVITNKQYIVGYNAGFGSGTHLSSFARVMKELTGGGRITNFKDAVYLSETCNKNFLCARFLFEYIGTDRDNIPLYDGNLVFMLSDVGYKITPQQFEVFKKFYEDYNEDIKYVVTKVSSRNFQIRYEYIDGNGQHIQKYCDSFDELYGYLANNIDYEKIIEEEPVIVGKTPDSLKR